MCRFTLIQFIAAGNPLDPPEVSQPVVYVVMGVLAILGAGILILTFAKLWREVLGRPAAIAVDIGAHPASKDKSTDSGKRLEVDITGFVPQKDFDAHKEEARLRAVGLEKQISESRHDWKEELNAVLNAAKLRDEVTEDWRDEITKDVKQTALKLAGVEKQADMIQTTQHNMDHKIDRLIERHIPSARTS